MPRVRITAPMANFSDFFMGMRFDRSVCLMDREAFDRKIRHGTITRMELEGFTFEFLPDETPPEASVPRPQATTRKTPKRTPA